MMRAVRSPFALLALLAVGLVFAALLEGHEASPTRPAVDASTETSRAGYSVFAQLLAREGVRVEAFDARPGELDDDVDTVIEAYALPADGSGAASATVARTINDLDDLRAWVARGGRAVVIGVDSRIAPREREVFGRPGVREARGAGAPYRGPLAVGIASLAGTGDARFLPVRGARVLLADRGGVLAVAVPIGRGSVWYLASPASQFANGTIARRDNARLAYAIGRPRFAGGRVAFDDGLHVAIVDPSWWSIMPVWLRVALAGWLLTALLWLAGGALRLGPALPERAPEPTSAGFLDAITALYERAGASPEVR